MSNRLCDLLNAVESTGPYKQFAKPMITTLERFNIGRDLLDITHEKCEHFSLLGSETHT
jgi:hypothetical protein